MSLSVQFNTPNTLPLVIFLLFATVSMSHCPVECIFVVIVHLLLSYLNIMFKQFLPILSFSLVLFYCIQYKIKLDICNIFFICFYDLFNSWEYKILLLHF